MNNNEAEITKIEREVKEAKEHQALGKALDRLLGNRDFRAVILTGYFKDEAVRLVHLRGDPEFKDAEAQASIIKGIDAIASLNTFLKKIGMQHELADKAIEDGESTLEVMREEDLAADKEGA